MKIFILIATVVACTYAAPAAQLQHPSPVNPDVLVEIKPQEKIIYITDPQELAKFKRETKQPLYPTVLPQGSVHHITKREEIIHTTKPEILSSDNLQQPQIVPVIVPQVVVVKESSVVTSKPEVEVPTKKDKKDAVADTSVDKKDNAEGYQKPGGYPAIFSPSNKKRDIPVPLIPRHNHPEESSNESEEQKPKEEKHKTSSSEVNEKSEQKRDIPVPLVPKHQHPEESPKDDNESDKHEDKKEENSHIQHAPIEGYQKPVTLPIILKEAEDTQHKRDIPVPLVPKYHHPEESPKDNSEKESQEDKKTPPQTIPVNNKETLEDSQHKRDIPVPLVPKYHHPEESPKESMEKENYEDKKDQHAVTESSEKPHTSTDKLKESSEDTQHKRDIPVPLVPKYHHPEESPKESTDKESEESKKNDNTENKLPLILKETSEEHHKQQSEVAPKDNIRKDTEDVKKELHSDNAYVTAEKVQLLTAILKEKNNNAQHKRDTLTSIDQQSLKDNIDEKVGHEQKIEDHSLNENMPQFHHLPQKLNHEQKNEAQTENHHIPQYHRLTHISNEDQKNQEQAENHYVTQIHHISQTIPLHNPEHMTTEGLHKPQALPVYHREHLQPPQFHQIQPANHEMIVPHHNDNKEHDLPTRHITQTLPEHIHKNVEHHFHPEILQKPVHFTEPNHNAPMTDKNHLEENQLQLTENQKEEPNHLTGDHAGPQQIHLPIHHDLQNHEEKKEIVKKTDHIEDVSDSVYQGHHILPTEGEHKELHESTEKVKKSADDHPDPHKVQIEDLSGTVYQKSEHHHIPHIQGEHKDSYDSTDKVKKSADNHPNPHEVQIEDLSGTVYQRPVHHNNHRNQEEHKESHESTEKVKKSVENHPNPHEVHVEDLTDSVYQKPNGHNSSPHPNPHEVQVEDLSGTVYQRPVHHNNQEEHKESHESTEKVKKSVDNHPNPHEVQIEDLSGTVYQKPEHHHTQLNQKIADNHPNPHEVQIEDLSGTVYQKPVKRDNHRNQEEHKESHESTETLKKSVNNHPNPHEVQVEDLTDSVYQKPDGHNTPPHHHHEDKDKVNNSADKHPNPLEVQIEDLSGTVYQKPEHHHDAHSHENKDKVKKSVDHHPNPHEVQIEDLSGSVYQKPNNEQTKKTADDHPNPHEVQIEDLSETIYQKDHNKQSEHKPNILDDHLSAFDVTTSTTDHPVLRRRPVPVAELFARAHNN